MSHSPMNSTAEDPLTIPLAGPWRRFFARHIDMFLLGLPTGTVLFIALVYSQSADWLLSTENPLLFGWFATPFILLAEACIFGLFGNTPGKKIAGIKVITVGGNRPTFEQYASRLANLYWSGLGTAFPIIALFTMSRQYKRLTRREQASYDQGNFTVRAHKLSFFRVLAITLSLLVMILVYGLLAAMPTELQPTQATDTFWLNNDTRIVATLPPGWSHEEQNNADNQPIHVFASTKFDTTVVFAREHVAQHISVDEYASMWANAVSADMQLTLAGHEIVIANQTALKLTGTLVAEPSVKVDAYLIDQDAMVWRFVSFDATSSQPSASAIRDLRTVLLNTLN